LADEHDIHQNKDVRDRNGLAIVDKGMQTIKRSLAAETGKTRKGNWAAVAKKTVQDYNHTPNPAVHGPPDSIEHNPVQEFSVEQDNADKFAHNNKNAKRMKAAVEASATEDNMGMVRAPINNGGRSFKPTYGQARPVENMDSEYVYLRGHQAAIGRGESGEDKNVLLKQAQPGNVGKFQTDLAAPAGKLKNIGSDLGAAVRGFKKGMSDEEESAKETKDAKAVAQAADDSKKA
jgi:hypothetical protein